MKPHKKERAFTLAELLISTAITTLLVVLLAKALATTTSVYQITDQRMDAFRDAKAALQMMTTDFSRADVGGDPQMMNLSAYSSGGSYAKEAYAITPIKNKGKSDLCAVGYYLDWDGASKTYSLRRFVKNSDITATSLAKSSVDFGTLYSRTSNANPETIASYVWDLEFRPGQGQNALPLGGTNSGQWNWIEIRFKAMSVKAGRKVASIGTVSQSTWDDPKSQEYKRFILPNEQQFVTRVSLFQTQ
jgi:type II secretory pathway pseudopilin PulG